MFLGIQSVVESVMTSIDDARLWVGKTIEQSDTNADLRSALEEVSSLLDEAEASDYEGEYLRAADKTQHALDLVESAVSQEEWPTEGHNYRSEVQSHTIPHLEDLADAFESKAE
jgi:antitoxin component HigA of HigAB toxin-antitoxin module